MTTAAPTSRARPRRHDAAAQGHDAAAQGHDAAAQGHDAAAQGHNAAAQRRDARWREHDAAWRDPAQVVAQCEQAHPVAPELLRCEVRGDWWGVLERLDACLVVSREYEHLLLALTMTPEGPRRSFMALPHPSGLAFDARARRLHVASTRNPNQLYTLAPTGSGEEHASASPLNGKEPAPPPAGSRESHMEHVDGPADPRPLAPLSTSFLPGRLYLHDLAFVGGALHGNAVGLNAIVRFTAKGTYEVAWWPRSIEREGRPDLSRNYLQLNSIAAGEELSSSFFSASAEAPSTRRPGHRNFAVDRRGVIFSGATREPIARGLTRPHSARLHGGEVWVDDSGYGRVGVVRDGRLEPVCRLPGWTRGLTFAGDVAFVGTSRVIPRFAHYAPGLDVTHSVCGVHAVDSSSGEPLGSILWPAGNQIFDIAVLPRGQTLGFPALAGRRQSGRALRSFFFSFRVPDPQEKNE